MSARPAAVRLVSVLAAAAIGASLAACAPAGPAPTVAPEAGGLPDGVTAELQQGRSDVAARQAQVVVSNATDETLVIADVTVDDPRFDGPAVRVEDRESIITPGRTVGIRVQLPDVACGDGVSGETEDLTLAFDYTLGDDAGRASASIDDPLGFLPPLHDRDCRAAAVERAAHVSFVDFDPSAPGEPAALVLGVAPTGRGNAGITGIQTTNLITFGDGASATIETFPIGLQIDDSGTGSVEISLPIVPLRCDPHAVQEDKRGTIFDVEVEVDGRPGEIELAASEDLRGEILTWVAEWCGFGG